MALDQYLKVYQGVTKVMISDEAKLYFAENQIFGVSPNIMNTWYSNEVFFYINLGKFGQY